MVPKLSHVNKHNGGFLYCSDIIGLENYQTVDKQIGV